MKTYEATEQAYKNGYEQGKKDALKWIPVTERLPKKDGHYLCNYHFGEYPKMTFTQVLDYYATDIVPHFQHTLGDGSMKVTHWMPLPEPPKGERVMFGSIKLAKEIKAWQRSMEQEKKPMTNADRIRAMSDEDLARYMAELIDNIDSQTCCYSNIPDEWLSWLQQTAEVE